MAERSRIDQVVHKDYDERVHHRRPTGISNLKFGALVGIVLLALTYLAFAKELPWSSDEYELTAVFDSSVTLRTTNPVRIAGVDVGEVTGITRKGDGAEVTFSVDGQGQPIHEDAMVKIRPRLWLEGNLFLDVHPGSPSAPELASGATIPVTQTSRSVQLDEILTSLQQDDRRNLSRLLRGYGGALMHEPTAAEDADQDPDVHGETAAQAINDSFQYGARAGKGSAQVSEAFRGTEPGDLARLLRGGGRTFGALASSETDLKGLITNFNITAGALASESANLSATIHELAPTIENTRSSMVRLNETLPPLRSFSRALEPAMDDLGRTVAAGRPWLRQGDRLLDRGELAGLARILRAATPDLVDATVSAPPMLRQMELLSRCTSDVLVPTGDIVIEDDFSTGVENYKEFFFGAAAQSGETQNFDGNGSYLRVQPSGGGVKTRAENPRGAFLDTVFYANTIAAPIGTQPRLADSPPPIRSDVACHTNDLPDLNGPAAAVGPPSPRAVP